MVGWNRLRMLTRPVALMLATILWACEAQACLICIPYPTTTHADLDQILILKTHRDVFPGLSARSLARSDAGHRKGRATLSESPGRASLWVFSIKTWS